MKKYNPNSKLTPELVKIITDLFVYTNKGDGEIGEFFNVSRETINSIRNGRRWQKVTGIETTKGHTDITRRVVKKIPTWWREDTEALIISKINELIKNDQNG